MVISLAALAGKSALSPLQGLGFGFGYGYGVRLGYHSFNPSKNHKTTALRLSPEPTTAGVGMGLGSAEEITAKKIKQAPLKGLTTTPTKEQDPNDVQTTKKPTYTGYDHDPKNNFIRKEAGAVVATINKDRAKKMMFYAGQPTDDRTVRRHFIKKLYPFNK